MENQARPMTLEERRALVIEDIQAHEELAMVAGYQALHNRIEDYTRWLISEGFLARNSIAGPNGGINDYEDFLFEHVTAYLEQVIEHEDTHPVDAIRFPDLTEFTPATPEGSEE